MRNGSRPTIPAAGTQNQTTGSGDWYYRYQFNLAPSVNPSKFGLNIKWLADNSVAAVWVNGVAQSGANLPQNTSAPYGYNGFTLANAASTLLNSNWQTGLNTIMLQVKSLSIDEGFDAQVTPSALCPSITVSKTVAGRVDVADQFTVAVQDSSAAVLTSATTTGALTSATSPIGYVDFGSTYTMTDAMAAGSASPLSNYTGTISCTDTITATSVIPGGTFPSWTLPVSNPDTYVCTVTNTPKTDTLSIVKTAGTPVDVNGDGLTDAGDTIAYTFAVTNTGQLPMSNIAVSDPKVGLVTCAAGPLAAGASRTCAANSPYTITSADVTDGAVDNSATASGTPPGSTTPVTSPPSSTHTPTTAPKPAIALAKSATPTTITAAGQNVAYSFLVTNTGNVPLTNATVTDTAFSGTGTAPTITCPAAAASLAPGASVTCAAGYTATQADADSGKITNTATATATSPPGDGTPVSPPSTAVVTIPAAPAITVVKSASPSTITAAGQTVTYSFLVTNSGNVSLSDPVVTETTFTGTGAAPTVSCPAVSMVPGGTTTCTATYVATQADVDAGSVSNTATATATPPAGHAPPVSGPSTATVTATPAPAILVVKSASPSDAAHYTVGQVITYSFVMTNTGNVTLTERDSHRRRVQRVRARCLHPPARPGPAR